MNPRLYADLTLNSILAQFSNEELNWVRKISIFHLEAQMPLSVLCCTNTDDLIFMLYFLLFILSY